jgi:hypothetical protein
MAEKELGLLDLNGPIDAETGMVVPATAVARRAQKLMEEWNFVRFKGRCLILQQGDYPHYVPLRKEQFDVMAYKTWGGLTRGQVNDMYSFVQASAPDMCDNDHLVAFGNVAIPEGFDPFNEATTTPKGWAQPLVWDMKELGWRPELSATDCVWRSPYSPLLAPQEFFFISDKEPEDRPRLKFIMDLAGQDVGLYDDIMQSIAPIIMDKKPDGVVWWVGNGANGKSTLMDALYKMFPGHFASITVKRLVDGRDNPTLNGVLANVVKESSEGRVDDTEIYKSLGTHENFEAHKFHSQESISINGNIHSIFSANQIPAFNDKGYSARRRTFIIPFNEQFASDPDFEYKTFTPEFFGTLAREMGWYANKLKKQGLRYKWSAATTGAKEEYDREASNAEEYARHLIEQGCVAFDSYLPIRQHYENWCADNGYPPLGIQNLRKAMTSVGFEAVPKRNGTKMTRIYRLNTIDADAPLELMGLGTPGLFTTYGFAPKPVDIEPAKKQTRQTTILDGKW